MYVEVLCMCVGRKAGWKGPGVGRLWSTL